MYRERLTLGILLGLVGLLTSIDIVEDLSEGVGIGHLSLEIGIALSSFGALAFLWSQILKQKHHSKKLEEEKILLKEIALKYKQKSLAFVEGLGLQIDQTFIQWKLSHAERDIALFLLKGLSPKKIAEIRNSSEKTVRHQINSIYKKGQLKGREDLTAYFLEDLLTPQSSNESAPL